MRRPSFREPRLYPSAQEADPLEARADGRAESRSAHWSQSRLEPLSERDWDLSVDMPSDEVPSAASPETGTVAASPSLSFRSAAEKAGSGARASSSAPPSLSAGSAGQPGSTLARWQGEKLKLEVAVLKAQLHNLELDATLKQAQMEKQAPALYRAALSGTPSVAPRRRSRAMVWVGGVLVAVLLLLLAGGLLWAAVLIGVVDLDSLGWALVS
ncbi:hypothetical protein [Oecophyllibacter saccharovorans]|uniref:hypothetical protein n=1 Tax=Oecophyllibacter saccharovorans TaxID=2558360 RepID=UPI0011747BD7|nr:hypothetical protein [Oecophyllibacter saccharovorans]TPW35234.1 hypothetical protein E3203_07195 [Oecophyllibacter saccharovorans]